MTDDQNRDYCNDHALADSGVLEAEWVYVGNEAVVEGVFPPLVQQLSREVEFDKVRFEFEKGLQFDEEQPWNRRSVLAIRRGLYRVLKIHLVRDVGRTIVRLRIMRQSDVRRILVICRDHFDGWFGLRTKEITDGPRDGIESHSDGHVVGSADEDF